MPRLNPNRSVKINPSQESGARAASRSRSSIPDRLQSITLTWPASGPATVERNPNADTTQTSGRSASSSCMPTTAYSAAVADEAGIATRSAPRPAIFATSAANSSLTGPKLAQRFACTAAADKVTTLAQSGCLGSTNGMIGLVIAKISQQCDFDALSLQKHAGRTIRSG